MLHEEAKKRREINDRWTYKQTEEKKNLRNKSSVRRSDLRDFDGICSIKSSNQTNISFVTNQIMRMTKASYYVAKHACDLIRLHQVLLRLLLCCPHSLPFLSPFLLSSERALVCSEQTHTHAHLYRKKAIEAVAVDISPFFFVFLFFSLHGINYPKEEKKKSPSMK